MFPSSAGRPRQVDTSAQFCPQPQCAYSGWVGLGNLRANGHPNGGRWRQLQCLGCKTYFLETHGTPLHGKRVAPEVMVWVVGALAEGLNQTTGDWHRGAPADTSRVVRSLNQS